MVVGQLYMEDEGAVTVALSKGVLEEVRKNMPVHEHKRAEVYKKR